MLLEEALPLVYSSWKSVKHIISECNDSFLTEKFLHWFRFFERFV